VSGSPGEILPGDPFTTITPRSDFRTAVHAARQIASDLAGLIASIEALMSNHEEAGARLKQLEQQHEELRLQGERLRQERDDLARNLAELRVAHEALLRRQERSQGGQLRKVMVVDDAPSDLRMMESILRSAGHDVVAYAHGERIEDEVAAHQPDLVLLDIVMPERNGYEILRALKKDERTKHTPVVIVTGRSQESDRVWSRRQGADDYITKPFASEELLTIVQKLAG